MDPLCGEPLHYARRDRGYVLYSVGEDREDNGGIEEHEDPGEDVDRVWEVSRE